MAEFKRRRGRYNKHEEKRPIILAKRSDDDRAGDAKPKILLKSKPESDSKDEREIQSNNVSDDLPSTSAAALAHMAYKAMMATRGEVTQSPVPSNSSPNLAKELSNADAGGIPSVTPQILEPVPQMNRPATLISSTGSILGNGRKLLMKSNTDFLVVGVIGTQGVGKSTIMSMLANHFPVTEYYQRLYVEKDTMFPTKVNVHRISARPRTESLHMFITSERIILLDSPPVLCNPNRKDIIDSELDDLRNIIALLTVCHLLIVVEDDYINMNFIRLLKQAELMKPTHDNKPFVSGYFPNLLFVKNRAKRQDHSSDAKERRQKMLKAFFKDSQLRIYVGQTTEQPRGKRNRQSESDRMVNTFLMPAFSGPDATPFHDSVSNIVDEFRSLVLMTPRGDICVRSTDLTEAIWFDLLSTVIQDTHQFFLKTYEEIQRKQFDICTNTSNMQLQ